MLSRHPTTPGSQHGGGGARSPQHSRGTPMPDSGRRCASPSGAGKDLKEIIRPKERGRNEPPRPFLWARSRGLTVFSPWQSPRARGRAPSRMREAGPAGPWAALPSQACESMGGSARGRGGRGILGTPTAGIQSRPPSPPRRQQRVTVAMASNETEAGRGASVADRHQTRMAPAETPMPARWSRPFFPVKTRARMRRCSGAEPPASPGRAPRMVGRDPGWGAGRACGAVQTRWTTFCPSAH